MTNELTQYNPKLKPYHIIIVACLLSPLLILNSNYVNSQRATEKLNKEKSKLFDQIISSRHLQENEGDEKPLTGSDKVCQKGSKELISYYKTGDLSKIDLDDKPIKCEEKGKPYFEALLNIVKSLADEGDGETDNSNQSGENHEGESTRRNLLEIGEIQDDLTTYVKHLIGILIFLVIGILSLPGWLVCCFCNCCNCCCCCCCKKRNCKIPCFIFTYIFYVLAVVVCIYGLSQTKKIFVGMADTECSILKFFDQVLEGETKQEMPRWAGIDGINGILQNLYNSINEMKDGTYNDLETQIGYINDKKVEFLGLMEGADAFLYDTNGEYKSLQNYEGTNSYNFEGEDEDVNGKYVFDLVNMFGKYDSTQKKFLPANSTLDAWEYEYKRVSEIADDYLGQAKDGFKEILSESSGQVLESLKSGKDTLSDLRGSFNEIKSGAVDSIYDVSDIIDEYGKLGSNLVFGVLGGLNIALAVFMLMICLFSGKMCANCCCCRCIFKFFTHLIWNILALLMFVTFLVGFLFSFIGTLGEDVMSVLQYVVSEDNLGKDGVGGDGILVGSLEDAKSYLDRCVNGDGQIEKEIGLELNQINSFDNISEAEAIIENTKNQFVEKKDFVTYNIYKKLMDSRSLLESSEFFLIPIDQDFNAEDKSKFLSFGWTLKRMNDYIKTKALDEYKQESWEITDYDNSKTCVAGTPNNDPPYSGKIVFSPLKCKPYDRDWIPDSDVNIKGRAKIISDTIEKIYLLKSDYYGKLEELKGSYNTYLTTYIDALEFFNDKIKSITSSIRAYIGDGTNLFGFVKCNFIGTNLKIMLKYLKTALGKNIKTVGICLTIVGCSLALSISSTILLIVIINISLEEEKPKPPQTVQGPIPEYNNGNYGQDPNINIIQYQS